MFGSLKQILGGSAPVIDFVDLKTRGAQIVDVRSADEFSGGHVEGAINLPVQSLAHTLTRLRKDRPVITCCASGMRSASAKSLLDRHGFAEVVNGGSWVSLSRALNTH